MCLKELFLKLNSALIRKSLPHFFPSYLSQEVVVKEKVNGFLCVLSRWLSGKNSAWQCRRHKRQEFDPWVGKIPWRRMGTHSVQFSSVQSLSCVRLPATRWTTAHQASLPITNSWGLPKLMSIDSVMPSSHLILCRPLLLLPSIFPASGSFPMSQLFASGG